MEVRQKATCEDDAIFLSFLTHTEHVCKTFSTKCFLSGSNHATKHGERLGGCGGGSSRGQGAERLPRPPRTQGRCEQSEAPRAAGPLPFS